MADRTRVTSLMGGTPTLDGNSGTWLQPGRPPLTIPDAYRQILPFFGIPPAPVPTTSRADEPECPRVSVWYISSTVTGGTRCLPGQLGQEHAAVLQGLRRLLVVQRSWPAKRGSSAGTLSPPDGLGSSTST